MPNAAGRADALERRLHRRRVDRRRLVAFEAEQNRTIGAVAAPRQRERAVGLRDHFADAIEQRHPFEVVRESTGRVHRAHRMRARRTDADLENVEDSSGS